VITRFGYPPINRWAILRRSYGTISFETDKSVGYSQTFLRNYQHLLNLNAALGGQLLVPA